VSKSGSINPLGKEVQFSDLGITMTAHPITGNVTVKKNAEAVVGALKNLILTNRFERPYDPLYGADIRSRLFEHFDPIEQVNIEEDIKTAIKNFEPRARVNEVTVVASPNSSKVQISINFFVANQAQPITVGLEIERTR
jgi:phage baseplate assembly protein W|tara:strand:- start:1391 stop:1807 length:417 start_codon:yes stop_codon:yes gene_type:complete